MELSDISPHLSQTSPAKWQHTALCSICLLQTADKCAIIVCVGGGGGGIRECVRLRVPCRSCLFGFFSFELIVVVVVVVVFVVVVVVVVFLLRYDKCPLRCSGNQEETCATDWLKHE